LIRSVPQAVARAATAINELEMRRTLAGRLMKAGIIIGIPMPELRPSTLLLAAVTSAAVVVGCGHTDVVGAERTLQLGLTEYRLVPQKVRVSAGSLTIDVHNYGRLTHDLVVSLNGQQQASTGPIWPGDSDQLTVTLTPGRYLMSSSILSDQTLGAYGTLTVTS
jgi:hypothetical protein